MYKYEIIDNSKNGISRTGKVNNWEELIDIVPYEARDLIFEGMISSKNIYGNMTIIIEKL